jgi:transposase-like protein
MSRPLAVPAAEKTRIVLSVLAGELSVAEAARRVKVSEQSVGTWKRQFLEAGRAGLTAVGMTTAFQLGNPSSSDGVNAVAPTIA